MPCLPLKNNSSSDCSIRRFKGQDVEFCSVAPHVEFGKRPFVEIIQITGHRAAICRS